MKNIFALIFLGLMIGCASQPHTPLLGPLFQVFFEEEATIEVAYQTIAQCDQASKNLFPALQNSDVQTQKAFREGRLRITCSHISQKNKLPHRAVLHHVMTNANYEIRFKSAGACLLNVQTYKGSAEQLNCYPWDQINNAANWQGIPLQIDWFDINSRNWSKFYCNLKGKNYAQQINSNYFSIAITTHVNSAPLNPSGPEAKQLEAMGFEVKVLSGTAHFEHYERNPTCPLSDQIKNRQKDSDKKVLDVRRWKRSISWST